MCSRWCSGDHLQGWENHGTSGDFNSFQQHFNLWTSWKFPDLERQQKTIQNGVTSSQNHFWKPWPWIAWIAMGFWPLLDTPGGGNQQALTATYIGTTHWYLIDKQLTKRCHIFVESRYIYCNHTREKALLEWSSLSSLRTKHHFLEVISGSCHLDKWRQVASWPSFWDSDWSMFSLSYDFPRELAVWGVYGIPHFSASTKTNQVAC